jgi:hypothetical protein
MEPHGVVYSGGNVIQSFSEGSGAYIRVEDHFKLVTRYRQQIEEMTRGTAVTGKLIGLSGHAGSGKTTAALILAEDFGFVRIRFADTLKKMLRVMLQEAGLSEAEIFDAIDGKSKEAPLNVLGGKSPRHCMQTLGTEWGRNCLSNTIWTEITRSVIERNLANGNKVVVDDIRFQNEIDIIGELGGDVYSVYRPGHASIDLSAHISEMALPCEKQLRNAGTIADLEAEIAKIV